MSSHVLLNLINELRKRDKMRVLPSILSLFRNKFNKINDTGAQMCDWMFSLIFMFQGQAIYKGSYMSAPLVADIEELT